MEPEIGLDATVRKQVCKVLESMLADQYVLYTKTRNYHWNVTGEDFSEYHKLFEAQYSSIDEDIDEVAERIRMLGGKTSATLVEFVNIARLKENPGQFLSAKEMISSLLKDHESVIIQLRKDIETCDDLDDDGTEDFLTQLLQKHEKTAWMLRAILEG